LFRYSFDDHLDPHSFPTRRSSDLEAEAKSTDNNGKPVTDTATLEGKTDHDNDPSTPDQGGLDRVDGAITAEIDPKAGTVSGTVRSEEHTSELQSRENLVCRLLLEK